MKKLLFLISCFLFIRAEAQQKSSLHFFVEANGMRVNNIEYNYLYTSYRLLDSATGLFKRYNTNMTQEIKSKITPGLAAGATYIYSVNKFFKLKAGVNINTSKIERDIVFVTKFLDSSTVNLQGTGPTWTDPSNGNIVRWTPPGPGSPWGSIFNNTGGVSIINASRYQFRHPGQGTEKLKLITLEVPFGVILKPGNSSFSLNADISPVFILSSSTTVNYNPTTETYAPDPPEYNFNKTMLRIGAGISYKINNSFEAAINYKHHLGSLLKDENIKLRSVGLQIIYTLPLKINP